MTTTIYNIALVTHIIGITVMAGTTFIDYMAFKAFAKIIQKDNTKALVINTYLNQLQRFLGIGMLLILLSGVMMMIKLHELWGAQLWFRIKMGVLLLIIINGLGLRRVLGSKLKKLLTEKFTPKEWNGLKKKFVSVQTIQMVLFIIIYVLSVFKFN